jgi:hypothetical protein
LKNGQHESCRAWKVEQLSCWEFFKLLNKIKSNFGNSVLPQFKNLEFLWFEFEFQNCLGKFTSFHSDLALATKRCFVAHKILYNFYFDEILTSIQSLVAFHKKTESTLGKRGG